MSIVATGIAGGAVNITGAVLKHKDPWKVTLASFLWIGGLLALGTIDEGWASVMGIAYLITSILLQGVAISNSLGKVVR